MQKILIPISFSAASANSLLHAYELDPNAKFTLLHCYPVQSYSRPYDFGTQDYEWGIKEKLNLFYHQHLGHIFWKPVLLIKTGAVSEVVRQISDQYDLMMLSRKSNPRGKSGYFTQKQLFIIARAACPVLIMPVNSKSFRFDTCDHIWHIQRRDGEREIVTEGIARLGIEAGRLETKSVMQQSYLSAFWKNLMAYESTHDQQLLRAIDQAHDQEPIDLIVLVDHEQSVFINFLKSDTIRIFCKYKIPLLVFPASAKELK